jgi:hypothetical protein
LPLLTVDQPSAPGRADSVPSCCWGNF